MADHSVMGENDVEVIADDRFELAEGPAWDDIAGELLWVDIPEEIVHRWNPVSGARRRQFVGGPVGAAIPRIGGGLVLARRDGFYLLDPGAERPRLVARVAETATDPILNDAKCDPAGRLWGGTAQVIEGGRPGTLYRFDPDGSVHPMLEGIGMSNGLGWSPDATRFYYVDTPTGRIDLYDFDLGSGTIANRRPFATVSPDDGMPDGLTVDAEGAIWLAIWGGWRVRRYLPDGTVDREIRVPASNASSCCFGGAELDELYITSATENLGPAELAAQPHPGSVFRARPGVRGRPVDRFAG